MSAPLITLTSFHALKNFLLMKKWSILLSVTWSGDHHVVLWIRLLIGRRWLREHTCLAILVHVLICVPITSCCVSVVSSTPSLHWSRPWVLSYHSSLLYPRLSVVVGKIHLSFRHQHQCREHYTELCSIWFYFSYYPEFDRFLSNKGAFCLQAFASGLHPQCGGLPPRCVLNTTVFLRWLASCVLSVTISVSPIPRRQLL